MLTVLSFMKMLNHPAGNDFMSFTKINTVSITFVRLLIMTVKVKLFPISLID